MPTHSEATKHRHVGVFSIHGRCTQSHLYFWCLNASFPWALAFSAFAILRGSACTHEYTEHKHGTAPHSIAWLRTLFCLSMAQHTKALKAALDSMVADGTQELQHAHASCAVCPTHASTACGARNPSSTSYLVRLLLLLPAFAAWLLACCCLCCCSLTRGCCCVCCTLLLNLPELTLRGCSSHTVSKKGREESQERSVGKVRLTEDTMQLWAGYQLMHCSLLLCLHDSLGAGRERKDNQTQQKPHMLPSTAAHAMRTAGRTSAP